ncbi:MAG: FAD-dependent oxidoreductase, partial [Verrucomicrobiota bacterium]|nr:FAD-dependent oxidoreductase [Verrucomicrobiota bacterium]
MKPSAFQRKWDVAILGAGPAGCALALMAVRAGLRVVLLEQQRYPKRRPGETLHPGAEPLFAQIGVWERIAAADFHRHHGVWVEWDAPRAFQSYGEDERGPWLGFQAERVRLDALLLAAVRGAG